MAFIPLATDVKIKGKASIDGIATRLGKWGCSLIQQIIFLLFSSLREATLFIAILLFGLLILWVVSVLKTGKNFQKATEPQSF
jgi:ATP:ADP antiporter, AAA family